MQLCIHLQTLCNSEVWLFLQLFQHTDVSVGLCGCALGQSTNIPQTPRPKRKCWTHITVFVDFNFFLVSAFYVWHQLSEFLEPLILC